MIELRERELEKEDQDYNIPLASRINKEYKFELKVHKDGNEDHDQLPRLSGARGSFRLPERCSSPIDATVRAAGTK